MKVLILCPYPHDEAPSQRFRFEQYLDYLEQHGVHCDVQSFWDLATWRILYKKGHTLKKTAGFVSGWWRRFGMLLSVKRYDRVFIHREAAPVGPPVIEWLIAKVWRRKIIYDYDDAIWLPNASAVNRFAGTMKWHGKVASVCGWSSKISCGNAYLADYARRYNENVTVIPTTVDTDYHANTKNNPRDVPVIGWTGSLSTNRYLDLLEPALVELKKRCDFEFLVISNYPPAIHVPCRFVKWSRENEIEDLLQMDIGVMPLPDDEWAKGKCGFKLIQYLSIGVPAVASPVGVNAEIVINGKTGFLANAIDEWVNALEALIKDVALRRQLGEQGRAHVESNYSVLSQRANYLKLFR